jgi:uncharacterized protein (TIGR02271 family)
MEPATRTYDGWIGRDAYDADGDKIGEITDIYYDDETGRPEWVAVKTGLFGSKHSFVPIHGSRVHGADGDGGNLQVAFDKDMVKGAPRIDDDAHLDPDQERELWSYYGYDYGYDVSRGKDFGYGKAYAGPRADEDYEWRQERDAIGDVDTRHDDAMTRSEEELHVGTERQATGRVRLRKYVVTENEQVTVPVSREEVRVEREPITDANIDSATSGPEITESEHEVVTHEERPVVAKETVPKERVRLDKDTVTEEKTISEEVRKERIEVDEGDTDVGDDRRP